METTIRLHGFPSLGKRAALAVTRFLSCFSAASAIVAPAVILVACGGGGANADRTSPAIPTTPQPAPLLVLNAWGDSLTQGGGVTAPWENSYTARLAAILGVVVNNYGIGGQNSTQIGGRQGGVPVRVSLDADIAGRLSGDSVTAIDNPLLSTVPADAWNYTQTGHLGTVHGTLSRTVVSGAETYIFFADSGTALQPVPPQTLFIPDQQATYSQGNLIWVGTNDGPLPNTVAANIASMVARIHDQKFIVISLINGSQGPPSPYYNDVILMNAELSNTYGKNYLDVRSALVASFDPSIGQDVIDHGNDLIPGSLRSDNIHLNAAGYRIVADAVADKIRSLGWQLGT